MSVHLIYDARYLKHDTGFHQENARRLEAILRVIDRDEDLSKKLIRDVPRPAANQDIVRCHQEDLIFQIESACESNEGYLDVDTRISPESFDVARLAAGAAIAAVDAAMAEEGGRAFGLIPPPGPSSAIPVAVAVCV